MNQPLYKIKAEHSDALNQMLEMGLEGDELADNMAALDMELDDKCLAVAAVIKNKLAEQAGVKQAASDMSDRARILGNEIERLKNYLANNMPDREIKNEQLVIRKKKGVQSVVIDDESKLPAQYINVKEVKTVDKKAIKADIDQLKGIAHLERGADTVVIK